MSDLPPAPAAAAPRARRSARALLWLLFALALAAGITGLSLIGTPTGHSYGFNIPWLIAFEAALADGTVYPRHLPDLWFGLGGLDFLFYGPLPFYLAAGPARWLCAACAPQTVFALSGGLLWAASALAFVPLARHFLPLGPALAAALIYALLPYHLAVDWFVRQAVGEFAAFIFLPLMAAGMLRVLRGGQMGFMLPLATAGLVLSHLPSVLLAAHVLGVIFVIWAIANPRAALPAAGRLLAMALAGIALAGLYWLPALVLLGDVSPDALYAPHMTAENWLYPAALTGPDPSLSLQILICLGAAVGTTAIALALRFTGPAGAQENGVSASLADWLIWVGVPTVLALVLMTAPSRLLWENWILDRVQFPFRLMLFVDMATALAAGSLVAALAQAASWRARALPLAGLALLALALAASGPKLLRTGLAGLEAVGTPVRMAGAPEYLPPPMFDPLAEQLREEGREAWRVPGLLEERAPGLIAAATGHDTRQSMARRWVLGGLAAGETVVVDLPYWRHLTARAADGSAVALSPTPEGLTRFQAPDPAQEVTIRLPLHWSEWLGAGLSLLGLAALPAWPMLSRRARRAGEGAGPESAGPEGAAADAPQPRAPGRTEARDNA